MERQVPSDFNTQIYEEACEWFVESRAGEQNDLGRQKFDRWLRKSPEHLRAYLEVAAIWNEAPSLDPTHRWDIDSLIAEAEHDTDNIVALSGTVRTDAELQGALAARTRSPSTPESTGISDAGISADPTMAGAGGTNAAVSASLLASAHSHADTFTHVSSRRSRIPHSSPLRRFGFNRSRFGAIGASIAAFTLLVAAVVWFELQRAPTYSTAIGEQRSLALPDGSTIELNSRSKIQVRYSPAERDVELLEGQALFHVAKDVARPFIVRSGKTRVRAVGTQFDVYQKHDDTVVTVVEGRVAIFAGGPSADTAATASSAVDAQSSNSPGLFPSSQGGGGAHILLSAGEQLTVTPRTMQKTEQANVTSATAWTQRQLVFDSASLSDVAEEFNRYNERKLIIHDPSLDNFHISGVFSSTDPASLIRFLRARSGLRIVETASEIRIEKITS